MHWLEQFLVYIILSYLIGDCVWLAMLSPVQSGMSRGST